MRDIIHCVTAMAVGAVAMYYLDPQSGRRRRALVCDKLESLRHEAQDYAQSKGTDAANRIMGLAAEARSNLADGPVGDQQLAERIRAELGRLVTRPGAIEVAVERGVACLSGKILAAEHETLVSAVAAMQGVLGVDDRISVHPGPDDVPELQG